MPVLEFGIVFHVFRVRGIADGDDDDATVSS